MKKTIIESRKKIKITKIYKDLGGSQGKPKCDLYQYEIKGVKHLIEDYNCN